MEQANEYHVASFVAQINVSHQEDIERAINQIPRAEIHAISTNGKVVFTIEATRHDIINEAIEAIRYQTGILTLAPVYHQYLIEE